MDHTVHVWNVWNKGSTAARVLKYHNAAVKNVRWSLHGPSLLSGGFDCSLRLVDVEEGKEIRVFKEDQAVEVIKFNPSNSNLFLSGGSKGSLRIWDIRSGLVTKEYHKSLGTILDIEFSSDGKQFISSTDTTRSNISENSIIIWDALRQVPLSNQVKDYWFILINSLIWHIIFLSLPHDIFPICMHTFNLCVLQS